MRKLALVAGMVFGLNPMALAAQTAAPVQVEFDADGNIVDPNRPLTCAQQRERAAAREVERQAALVRGEEPLHPYIVFCTEPPPQAAEASVASTTPVTVAAPGTIAAQFDRPLTTTGIATRSSLAGGQRQTREESAEEFYNRDRPRRDVLAQGDQENYAYSRSGQLGEDGEVEYESSYRQGCTENGLERTCSQSSSFSIGNSTEARNAAQEAVDRLLNDDD